MASDSTVFLRRDPAAKQWVTVPLADAAGDRLFYFKLSTLLPTFLSVGAGLVLAADTLSVSPAIANTVAVTTTAVPLTLDATHAVVIVSNGSGITLPNAVGIQNRKYNIIRSGTSNVTISTLGGTISGDTTLVLTGQWDSVSVISDGTNWVRCS